MTDLGVGVKNNQIFEIPNIYIRHTTFIRLPWQLKVV